MITKMNPKHNTFCLSAEDVKAIMSFTIGRTDFYWEYCNGVPYCKKKELTAEDLNNHLVGTKVFGGSPFIDNETIMFGGVDFDAHRDTNDTEEDYQKKIIEAQSDAKEVSEYLKGWKLPVVLNSSGSEGRHVRYYCAGAPAKNIRMYLKFVLFKLLGDPNKHEVFPKQDNLCEERPYGNQMKMALCIHPKKKKRANVIAGDKILGIKDSIKVMRMALENAGNIPKFSQQDYDTIQSLDKSYAYVEKYNTAEYTESMQDIPKYCSFFEDVATKYSLPSKDKYSRHFCLDSNMAGYGMTHPETRIAYANAQGRTSHTAFDNWKKYWIDGKPEFKCGMIVAYLRNHSKHGNKNALKGLKKCLSCPKFKEFMLKKLPVRGWAKSMSIIKFAEKHNFTKCPKCKNDFRFTDSHGFYECDKCNYRGGLTKFAELILRYKDE